MKNSGVCLKVVESEQPVETIIGADIAWQETGTEKGRGVFALRDFKQGEVLERAPVIPVSKRNVIDNGEAPDGYLLEWEGLYEDEEYCMPLGYVMLYNHSQTPNIMMDQDFENYIMSVTALRDIRKGEELCWNYNCDIWFEDQK
ncbi:MAG: SET domain-containing protein-lysine N-methyltransferase [Micavibrio aeruginosavorus]|uniref:SET domain-containing protein-lysine N-methyltransferase n=1 Tax=Micavibrio aeruginosavorus TaxID=349221 RepID=A0A7T5R1U0_9BACT|nr:MAG: SET domain-containing protein-lysine N-methyltransferase [Micavibrio aeruginosavorus]